MVWGKDFLRRACSRHELTGPGDRVRVSRRHQYVGGLAHGSVHTVTEIRPNGLGFKVLGKSGWFAFSLYDFEVRDLVKESHDWG